MALHSALAGALSAEKKQEGEQYRSPSCFFISDRNYSVLSIASELCSPVHQCG